MSDLLAEMRAAYDLQRREAVEVGFRRETAPGGVVCHLAENGGFGFVTWAELTPETADAIIEAQIAYFRQQKQSFEWKYYDYDQPADLMQRLIAHGFEVGEVEAIMALPLAKLPDKLRQPVTHDVRLVTSPDQAADALSIHRAVWGDEDDTADIFRDMLDRILQHPEAIQMMIVYVDGVPASYARIEFPPDSPFAGLWAGSTLPEYRGRGLYTALLAVRAQAALTRGRQYLNVDASPMSRPILEKLGFSVLALSYPCLWSYRNTMG